MKHLQSMLALLLAMALLLPLLSGCHGARSLEPFAMPETFDETQSYEITFWAKNDTNKSQVRVYENAIADFQALYPNIHVNLRLYTDYTRIYNDVITNIATNTTPNVCITYPDHIATYMTGSHVVVPLDQLMDHPAYGLGGGSLRFDAPTRDELVPQFLKECTLADATYALPFMRSTEACYVNKTYVEALGYTLPEVLTWDFIFEVSEAAMAKDAEGNFRINGQKVMIPFIYKSTDNMMIQYLRQRGAGYSTDAGDILLFNDETRTFLREIAAHAATGSFSTFKISGYPANFLNAGQCIFAVDSTAGATWMGSDAPLCDISEDKLVAFETAVFPVPQVDPAAPQIISQGPSICLFNKADSGEVLASWLFAAYLLTNKVQLGYAETEGYIPVTTKAQTDPDYLDYLARAGEDNDLHYAVKAEASRLLIDYVDASFVTPVFNGSVSLRSASGQLIEDATKAVKRRQTVDDAYLEKLFRDTSSLYRLDQTHALAAEQSAEELGPLPPTAMWLLGALGAAWVLIGLWVLLEQIKKKKRG